jgi:hypothetical protein
MILGEPAVTLALLLGFMASILDPAIMALSIPIIALMIPIVAILVKPMTERMKQAERKEARQLFERIVMEKLDVIKTAVAMGHKEDELNDLDMRLERLIGADKLAGLLDMDIPKVAALDPRSDLRDTDLDAEIERLQRKHGEKSRG